MNMEWRKSTFSGDAGCVEWSKTDDGGMLVRDSKDPDGPVLAFDRSETVAFVSAVRAGEFA